MKAGTIFKRTLALLTSIVLLCSCVLTISTAESYAAKNSHVKALGSAVQSFTRMKSSFTLTKASRFFIVTSEASEASGNTAPVPSTELTDTITLLCSEFASEKKPSQKPLAIVYGYEADASAGDIVIKISQNYDPQQYKLTIGEKAVIEAGTDSGVFYGLRTLLKYFIVGGSNTIDGCIIKDKPDVDERTAHLDCARKYFSKAWIKNFIKRMSWMGYNAIEIHFSDDRALRLESKKFPWLTGSSIDDKRYLTQKEMAEICATARQYHVEVIPSFDSPGHMNYHVKKYASYIGNHPNYSFTYKGKRYSKRSAGFKNISNYFMYSGQKSAYNYLGIDLSNPTARAFTNVLIDEYADFFKKQGCTKFNIGGDELLGWSNVTVGGRTFTNNTKWHALQHWDNYARKKLRIRNGSAADTFIDYMNDTASRLEEKGYVCRVWNDEINRMGNQHIRLKKTVDIVFWSNNYAPLSKLKRKGYRFHNAISTWTYYVSKPGGDGGYKHSNKADIYKYWNPKSFANPFKGAKRVRSSKYLGAYFCIWCDYPTGRTQEQVWSDTSGRMWSSSAKMWNTQITTKKSGSGTALSYSKFARYTTQLGAFPGYSGDPAKNSKLPAAPSVKPASGAEETLTISDAEI